MKGPKDSVRPKLSVRKGIVLARRQAFKAKLKNKALRAATKSPEKGISANAVVKSDGNNDAMKVNKTNKSTATAGAEETLADETMIASDEETPSTGTASTASSDSDSDAEGEDATSVQLTPSSKAGSAVFVYDLSQEGGMSSGKNFAHCHAIESALRRQLEFLNFTKMTNVQAEAIPALIKSSKNALIRSETGSGKTLAFLVPAINNVLCQEAAKRKSMIAAGVLRSDDVRTPVFARSDGTRVIVISPTRELAVQTVETAQKLAQAWPWMTTAALVSGTKRKSEKASLRKGITILVTTPGRILDHLDTTNSFDSRRLGTLVLDEVDRLLDLGFESKLRRICSELRENMKSTKMMRTQIAALAAGEECDKLIVDKDLFESQRQAQRQIARALLRESMQTPNQRPAATPKFFDDDDEGDVSNEAKVLEQISTPNSRTLGTIIDMSEEEEEVVGPTAPIAEFTAAPKIVNAADSARFEPDRESFQVVIVSATLNSEIEKLARFCLGKNAVWIHGKESTDTTSSADVEEVTEVDTDAAGKTKWVVPKSLKQAYIKLTTPKQRLLMLMSLLMMRIPKKKRVSVMFGCADLLSKSSLHKIPLFLQTIVFVNNCEAVEFLHAFCEAVKWPNPPDSLKRKRPGDFDGRKEKSKVREKARQMLTEVDDVLFQMSEDEAETNLQNSKDSLFTVQRVLEGLKAYRLHGSMSRDDRQAFLCMTQSNKFCRVGNLGDFNHCRDAAVMFATDVAARGLNMPEVDLVIHLDAPVEVSDYIHRIGRTARMGTQGTSVLFLNEHESSYVKVLEAAGACPNGIKESKEETLLSMWAPPTARTTKVVSFLPEELKKLRASVSVYNSLSTKSSFQDAQNFLMSRFTMFVEDDPALTDLAQKAYLSTVKTYRVYSETMRSHFDFGKLHLGHLAGSFLLRRSPNDIAASQRPQDTGVAGSRGRDRGGRGDRSPATRGRRGDRSFRGSDRGTSGGLSSRGPRWSARGSFGGVRSRGGLRGGRPRGGPRGDSPGGDRSRGEGHGNGFREVRAGDYGRGGRAGPRGGRGGSRVGSRGSRGGQRRDE